MGFWIDEDTYQFDDEKEMAANLGLDTETLEGDYAESYHWCNKMWEQCEIDMRFDS
jgi:hypothetical protein